jgi:predicted pyridoxine 5'-phosphate oxidase superfamily flavin-nucleotide-binding protein
MASNYAKLMFTDSVRRAQERYGSGAADVARHEDGRLSEGEQDFVAARDGFYMASVGENGWPYVQFRGGPAGFVKVLDDRTIGYADLRGNRQYVSMGRLRHDGRVALLFMDYAHRRRLKILARARVVDAAEDPELVARLEVPGYDARVERGVLFTVEAYEWNCPQHITPRFTEAEWAARA